MWISGGVRRKRCGQHAGAKSTHKNFTAVAPDFKIIGNSADRDFRCASPKVKLILGAGAGCEEPLGLPGGATPAPRREKFRISL